MLPEHRSFGNSTLSLHTDVSSLGLQSDFTAGSGAFLMRFIEIDGKLLVRARASSQNDPNVPEQLARQVGRVSNLGDRVIT